MNKKNILPYTKDKFWIQPFKNVGDIFLQITDEREILYEIFEIIPESNYVNCLARNIKEDKIYCVTSCLAWYRNCLKDIPYLIFEENIDKYYDNKNEN
jgi:hypothetical protein